METSESAYRTPDSGSRIFHVRRATPWALCVNCQALTRLLFQRLQKRSQCTSWSTHPTERLGSSLMASVGNGCPLCVFTYAHLGPLLHSSSKLTTVMDRWQLARTNHEEDAPCQVDLKVCVQRDFDCFEPTTDYRFVADIDPFGDPSGE